MDKNKNIIILKMEKDFLFTFSQIFIPLEISFSLISAETSNLNEINEEIPGNTDYKKFHLNLMI